MGRESVEASYLGPNRYPFAVDLDAGGAVYQRASPSPGRSKTDEDDHVATLRQATLEMVHHRPPVPPSIRI